MLASLKSFASQPDLYDPAHVVAVGKHGPITWLDIRLQVTELSIILADLETLGIGIPQKLQGHELIALLLACWQSGKVPVLSRPDGPTIAQTQPKNGTPLGLCAVDATELPPQSDDLALVIFTSGSTGAAIAVCKTFAQLDAEIHMLESQWGRDLGNCTFASAVSRCHMYGLPFGLLWPLIRGSCILSEPVDFIQSLASLKNLSPFALIASPVQLQYLPETADWTILSTAIERVFSAGAELPLSAAHNCAHKGINGIIEVYGSTETGAVAFRYPLLQQEKWHCLPGVDVKLDDTSDKLEISSPALSAETKTFLSADRACIDGDGRFELLGRSDSIVKIAGKRISLSQVERALNQHPWVAANRTLQLGGVNGRLGAVVALTSDGQAALIDRGRKWLNATFADCVRPHTDPVAIPRYWRYLSRLPANRQGKVSIEALRSLFSEEDQPRLPYVENASSSEYEAELSLLIPENLFYFSGHFPGSPILPGIVQLHWAIHFSEKLIGKKTFIGTENLKFQHILQPGDTVVLKLSWNAVQAKLSFSYAAGEKRHSSGRIILAPLLDSSAKRPSVGSGY